MPSPLWPFKQVVCVDKTGVTRLGVEELQSFSPKQKSSTIRIFPRTRLNLLSELTTVTVCS
jgi:hypothetical protein